MIQPSRISFWLLNGFSGLLEMCLNYDKGRRWAHREGSVGGRISEHNATIVWHKRFTFTLKYPVREVPPRQFGNGSFLSPERALRTDLLPAREGPPNGRPQALVGRTADSSTASTLAANPT